MNCRLRVLFLLLSCFGLTCQAEVIDRIVAIVNGHLVTLSDVRQERETRALLGEAPLDDTTLAKQIVDNYLIEEQIADYPNIEVPNSEVDAYFQKSDRRPSTIPESLRNAVRQRIRVQKFFEVKFRESIQATDDEVRKYYEEVFVPEAQKRGVQPIPPLTDKEVAEAVRENVVQESLDHEVGVWLEAIRRRSKVEVLQ
jgi:hypothetical protein